MTRYKNEKKKNSFSPPPPCLLRPHFFGRCSASITERPPPDWSQSWCSFFFLFSWASINTSPRLLTGERCPLIFFTHERKSMKYFFKRWCSISSREKKMRSLEAACAAASMRTAWCLHKRTSFFSSYKYIYLAVHNTVFFLFSLHNNISWWRRKRVYYIGKQLRKEMLN